MSTPSGKPFDQTSPPSFPSRRLNEEPLAGHEADEPPGDAAPSAYAPKRLRVISSAAPESSPADSEAAPSFLMRGNKPREQRVEPRLVVDPVDGPMRMHGAASDAGAQRRRAVDLDEQNSPEPNRRQGPEAAPGGDRSEMSTPQPGTERLSAETGNASQEADDMDRLEASLRWLKSQDADLHQPPRKPLLTAEPRARGLHGQRHNIPLAEAGMREPKPLEPESLMAPALRRAHRDSNRGTRWLLIAGLVAAPIAVLAVTLMPPASEPKLDVTPASATPASAMLASAESYPSVRTPAPMVQLPVLTFEEQTDDLAMPPAQTAPAVTRAPSPTRPPVPAETSEASRRALAMVAPPVPPAAERTVVAPPPAVAPPPPAVVPQAPEPASALRQMDPAEVRILVRQGEQFMAVGDVVAARMVFQRAAETGDAGAAMALGATYDPLILARLGAVGMVADVSKARLWYEKAKEFGSQEAPRRLELLANRR